MKSTTTIVLVHPDTQEFYFSCPHCYNIKEPEYREIYVPVTRQRTIPFVCPTLVDALNWMRHMCLMRVFLPRRNGQNHCIHIPEFIANLYPSVFTKVPSHLVRKRKDLYERLRTIE